MTGKSDPGFAPAKVNLTLHITGQRADGYHLLDSIVVFADVGDRLSAEVAEQSSLVVAGPEAEGVPSDSRNLVLKAAALCEATPQAFRLEKNLPTAAGIGGGSADAAAAVRLLNAAALPNEFLSLGADIPMCVAMCAARVRGIGEEITPLSNFPDMPAVLLNPRVAVPTPPVFKALTSKVNPQMQAVPESFDLPIEDLATWLSAQRNDLEAPAISLFPDIAIALSALKGSKDCLLARMSGSGATCFALFPNMDAACEAASALQAQHPDWWVKPCTLGSRNP